MLNRKPSLVILSMLAMMLMHTSDVTLVLAESMESMQEHRCDEVHGLQADVDQCDFVASHCTDESMALRLVVLYYCAPDGLIVGSFIKLCVVVTGALVLVTLFKLIGLTAEKYFSVMLSQISQDLGLPPRLAGVTLLALGNGAPDLSSSIAAIRSGNFNLAMGSLIGSVMFVGCVVAGRIVSLSNGIKSKAAQIRDVLALCIAVICVTLLSSFYRRVTYFGVSVLLSLYGTYVLLVAIADLTKKNYGIEWVGLLSLFSSSHSSYDASINENLGMPFMKRLKMALVPEDGIRYASQYEPLPATATHDDEESLHHHHQQQQQHQQSHVHDGSNTSSEVELTESPRKMGPVTERSTWGGSYGELQTCTDSPCNAEYRSLGQVQRSTSESTFQRRSHESLEYRDLVNMSTAEYRARALAAMSDATSFNKRPRPPHEEAHTLEEMLGTICEDSKEELQDSPEVNEDIGQNSTEENEGGTGVIDDGNRQTRKVVRFADGDGIDPTQSNKPIEDQDIHDHSSVRGLDSVRTALSMITGYMAIPVEYALRATIPIAADAESFDRTWFMISCFLSPIWTVILLSSFSPSWNHVFISIVVGVIFSFLAWYQTQDHEQQGRGNFRWTCGTTFPIGAALIAVYGFALAGMWIDAIAGELVGVIHAFGIIGHVKPSILGLTVLAWGNSLTDLMANISIAFRSSGGASMAMTACFAGPLFNVLLGLGIGFLFYLTESDMSSVTLEFDAIVFIGCMFAVINCIAIITIAVSNNQKLPQWAGWLMMCWYGLYMALILTIATVTHV